MGTSEVLSRLRAFGAERDWQQFHSAENLAKSISIESGELLECFQWSGVADQSALEEELADVLTYCYLLADKIGKSPDDLIQEKLAKTIVKYPLEKARGTSSKYDRL